MINIKKRQKFVDVLFFIIFIVNISFLLYDIAFKNSLFVKEILSNIKTGIFPILNFVILVEFFLVILYLLYRLIFIFSLKSIKKHEKFDLKYVRGDLEKITPSYAYYILKLDLDTDKCVNSTLIKLTHSQNLNIVNNKFELSDETLDNLKGSEKFLIKCLQNKRDSVEYKYQYDFKNDLFREAYKQVIIKELLEENYIKEKRILNENRVLFISILSLVFIFTLGIISTFFLDRDTINKIVGPIILLAFFIIIFLSFMYKTTIIKLNGTLDYVRTKKGEMLHHKILGLKKFLQDFSNIDDTKLEELKLREFYFVYSIIFELNDDENNRIEQIKINSINN